MKKTGNLFRVGAFSLMILVTSSFVQAGEEGEACPISACPAGYNCRPAKSEIKNNVYQVTCPVDASQANSKCCSH